MTRYFFVVLIMGLAGVAIVVKAAMTMLYYLFEWLNNHNFPGARMFGYTSFRALMAIILALLISSIWGDRFIDLLKKKQITETQRDASIDPFGVNKVGVPSMGGIIIIVAILIPCLLLGKLHNVYMILMLVTTVWLGSLGFADDYIKIFKRDKEGLHDWKPSPPESIKYGIES